MADTPETTRALKKYVVYPIEAVVVYAFYYLFNLFPMHWTANFTAFLFRHVGPMLKAHKTALDNLRHAFPEKSEEERKKIAVGVWDNLGRVGAEYMQLDKLQIKGDAPRIIVEGLEILEKTREETSQFVLFSAHMANWEVGAIVPARLGLKMTSIYRATSNPYVDKLVKRLRSNHNGILIPKGRKGARALISSMKKGDPLAALIDQKLNEGMAIPFFGRDCMTATAPVELALRYDCPIIPLQIIRLPNSRFKAIIHPPVEKPNTGDMQADTYSLLVDIHKIFEDWLTQHPTQWLWVHKRWPKTVDKKAEDKEEG